MIRRFVILGQTATASPTFSLLDVPGTSGRLDVLLRCLRSALLVSHGVRRDTIVYLVLLGGEDAPRVLRVDGRAVRFVRPDERMLAVLVQKALARAGKDTAPGVFVMIRDGLAVARGGLDAVLADWDPAQATHYVLEEDARDVRDVALPEGDVVVFVGDHRGFDAPTRERLAALGATAIGVGPISVHADDAIAIAHNQLDRAVASRSAAP